MVWCKRQVIHATPSQTRSDGWCLYLKSHVAAPPSIEVEAPFSLRALFRVNNFIRFYAQLLTSPDYMAEIVIFKRLFNLSLNVSSFFWPAFRETKK
jgi:hypothetical protein